MSKRKKATTRKRPSTALARREPAALPAQFTTEQLAANPMLIFAQLARDKNVDPGKLERMIAMQERVMAHNAKAAFDAAFAELAPKIPEMDEHGWITNKAGDVQSRYARHEDVQRVLRPLLAEHGFALKFKTHWPERGLVAVVGILTHREGHAESSEFRAGADESGNKNPTQAFASTISYGQRYTTKDLLNITSRGQDNGGQSGTHKHPPARPGTGTTSTAPAKNQAPPASTDRSSGEVISQAQRQRLFTIATKIGRKDTELKMWLKAVYGIDSSKLILRRDYDAIVACVEQPGPLPLKEVIDVQRVREPGEDG